MLRHAPTRSSRSPNVRSDKVMKVTRCPISARLSDKVMKVTRYPISSRLSDKVMKVTRCPISSRVSDKAMKVTECPISSRRVRVAGGEQMVDGGGKIVGAVYRLLDGDGCDGGIDGGVVGGGGWRWSCLNLLALPCELMKSRQTISSTPASTKARGQTKFSAPPPRRSRPSTPSASRAR